MRRRFTARFVNGVVSALVVVVFLVHGALGSAAMFTGVVSPFAWVVWGGMTLVGVHVIASIVTSVQQLGDKERPPSARKKRHLALKWATGALLAAAVAAHVVVPHSQVASLGIIVALSAVLAVHLCVGARSLLKDLELDRRYKMAFRAVVCAFAAVFAVCALVGIAMAG